MTDVLERLAVGDKRTTGAANAVAAEIQDDPTLFDRVFTGLYTEDPALRMRCADALEKASAHNPSLLVDHSTELLDIGTLTQQEVQWHVAQMLPRCDLTVAQRHRAVDMMCQYFDTSKSNIVRVFAVQALFDIAAQDATFKPVASEYIQKALAASSPSLRSRGRRLAVESSG